MNVNFQIIAKRDILVLATQQQEEQEHQVECYQTPSYVTERILNSDNPLLTYKEWVLERFDEDEFVQVYPNEDV